MTALRHLDLVIVAVALPIFLVAGFPILGWVFGTVAWVAQRVIKDAAEKRAVAIARKPSGEHTIADMRKVAGLTAGSMIGRGWLCAITIFAGYFVAGQDDAVGLGSAVLVIACFTVSFSTAMVTRPFQTRELPS